MSEEVRFETSGTLDEAFFTDELNEQAQKDLRSYLCAKCPQMKIIR